MKMTQVPQDQDPTYEGLTKLCYAQDEKGQYVGVPTNGWQVEEIVKDYAWQAIEKDLAQTRRRVGLGTSSPLEYFMKFRQMDPLLLSQNMGMWILHVKWHLRPSVFRRLNKKWLARYAECLEISVQELTSYKGDAQGASRES